MHSNWFFTYQIVFFRYVIIPFDCLQIFIISSLHMHSNNNSACPIKFRYGVVNLTHNVSMESEVFLKINKIIQDKYCLPGF